MKREIRKALKQIFGFSSFRPHQEDIVDAIVSGRDVFAVLPTGGGKSLCYQLPAVVLPGLTVVVSPLVALMKDQVDAAVGIGVAAAYLNSSLTGAEAAVVYRRLEVGEIKLLYVSPERLALEHFSAQLAQFDVRRFAIDEAHCLSEWGHDFRPDYLILSTIREQFPGISIAAFTATATVTVQRDIIRLLNLNDAYSVRASFNREELRYRVVPKEEANEQILDCILRHRNESGIVYRTSRADTEKTAKYLAKRGVKALPYHAGLDNEVRHRHQELFNRDEVDVIVATIAFGMGIDKSNVRYVIHGDLPRSMEGYYQETGRAGRDGLAAECLLLFGTGDIAKIRYHIDRLINKGERERGERNLNRMARYCSTNACRRRAILEYFGESSRDECGNCDVCLGETVTVEATVDAQKILSAVVRTGERFGAMHVVDVVSGADTDKIRKFGHDRLPTYGVGRDKNKRWWRSIVDELIAQQCLERDPDRYNALVMTRRGRSILTGENDFRAARRNQDESSRPGARIEPLLQADESLFDKLRDHRKRIASERGVPPYIIFSDKTLREMARILPDSSAEMLNVSGIGDKKLAAFGSSFLEIIRAHVRENDAE